jgi:hypothetical protein
VTGKVSGSLRKLAIAEGTISIPIGNGVAAALGMLAQQD